MSVELRSPSFSYGEAFSRNLGIVSRLEQSLLAQACVGLAGTGGVGGAYAVTLARMGVGRFHLADFDCFELVNFNRQQGATIKNLGRPKTAVIREQILDINPTAQVTVFDQGLSPKNLSDFLTSTNLVMDGLDAFAVSIRRQLHQACQAHRLHAIAAGPLGLTASLHVFGPGSMSFEDYFDFESCRNFEEEMIAFILGTSPALLHRKHIDPRSISLKDKRGPSLAPAIELCAALACAQALRILTLRGPAFLAPRYLQFDALNHRLVKRYLPLGNRHPWQRLKRRWALKLLGKNPP
ncbi:MAG: ThiF family adenylyltransferase [Bdellovibrionales bacterium]|nr:ThiF family adenylyltransferase [Bdellovibrionales bacterium]